MPERVEIREPGAERQAEERGCGRGTAEFSEQDEMLIDRIKGEGAYAEMAENMSNNFSAQLTDKGIQRADATQIAANATAAEKAAAAKATDRCYAADLSNDLERQDCTDELEALRQARLRQLKHQAQMNAHWQELGHGRYTEVESERTFFKDVEPHERTVCLLHKDNDMENPLHVALLELAKIHMETMFFHLHEEKAHVMLTMLSLSQGLPALLVLRHGKVVEQVSGRELARCRNQGRMALMLRGLGVLDEEKHSDEEDEDSRQSTPRDQRVNIFRRG
mmetsp:Transcript_29056/g.63995  ORF Transcript_29056/g.63995 Transcript_29056/m.63995 type:complete len:278 (+) Transcript_29056:49-882(+)